MLLNAYRVAEKLRDVVVVNPLANCAYPGVKEAYVEDELWEGPLHPSVLSYGSTRRMMSVFATCYRQQYGVRSVNLLVPNMYGPYDSTNPNKTHALNALVIKFVSAVRAKAPEIEVWGTGNPVREWLYVKDFAEAVRRVIDEDSRNEEPVNIGQERGHTVRELVDTLTRLTGYEGRITYNTKYQDGAPRKVMDARRFRERFPGFRFTPIDDGIRETIAFYERILA
jgi:GDP-L-fucose synthase